MRKIVFSFSMLCVLFLVGCLKPVEEEVEIYEYSIYTNTFETFFDVSYDLKPKDDGDYVGTIKVTPKFDFDVEDLSAKISLTVTKRSAKFKIQEVFTFDIVEAQTFEETFYVEKDEKTVIAFISEFDVRCITSVVETTNQTEIVIKAYPIISEDNQGIVIPILDVEKNTENYQAFMDYYESIMFMETSQATLSAIQTNIVLTPYEQNANQSKVIMRLTESPFGLEISANNQTRTIYESLEHNGYIYFETDPSKMLDDRYLIRPVMITEEKMQEAVDEAMESLGQLIQLEEAQAYIYKPENMLFEPISNGYKVTSLIRDILPAHSYRAMIDYYTKLGLSTDIIDTALYEISISKENNLIKLTIHMELDMYLPIEQRVVTIFELSIDLSEIQIRTMTDDDYIILPPDDITEVFEETNPFEPIYVAKSSSYEFFYVSLNVGTYNVISDYSYLYIEILDDEGAPVDVGITFGKISIKDYNTIFYIRENGNYYLKVRNNNNEGYTFNIERLNDLVTIDDKSSLVLGENTITLDGLYDLKHYTFDASEDAILKITGSNDELMYMANLYSTTGNDYYFYNQLLFINGSNSTYFILKKGENSIYFNSESPLTTTIYITTIETLHHKSKDLGSMVFITENYLDNPMLISSGLGAAYLRFDAKNATYQFSLQSNVGIDKMWIYVYDALTNERIKFIKPDETGVVTETFKEGQYYLEFNSSVHMEVNVNVSEVSIES